MTNNYITQLAKQAAVAALPLKEEKERRGLSDLERNLLAAPIGASAGVLGSYALNRAAMPIALRRGPTFTREELDSFLGASDIKHPVLLNSLTGVPNSIIPWNKIRPREQGSISDSVRRFLQEKGKDPTWDQAHLKKLRTWLEADRKSLLQLDKPFSRATAAHEAGHLRQRDLRGINDVTEALYHSTSPLKWGVPASFLTAAMPNRTAARIAALGTTAAMAPRLVHELMGSHQGGKLLAKHLGGSLWDKTKNYASAYKGVPTYAALALAPLLTYWAASSLGRWKDEDEDKPQKDRNRL